MKAEDVIRLDSEPSWFSKDEWALAVMCLEKGDAHPTLHVRTVDECHPQGVDTVIARFIFTAQRECELLAVWTERLSAQSSYLHGPPPSLGGTCRNDESTAGTHMTVGARLFVDRPIHRSFCK